MKQTIYLQLEDGTPFEGQSFGAPLTQNIISEVVFTTAMTGYAETLTDPSYYGQMVLQTFPLIGNYGINSSDFESKKIHMSAYIVHENCLEPSNFRSQMDLDTLLKQQHIPGISGIDTRALTRIIRSKGVMTGCLCLSPLNEDELQQLHNWKETDAVSKVTCNAPSFVPASLSKHNVVLWDFGAKENILRSLTYHDCNVTIVPATATCDDILALSPDGIMLSNGPGDPQDNPAIIKELRELCKHKIPTFGICLGHQLLALANGGQTEKLKYGHRGSNQPVKDLTSQKVYITSQNHGYAVKTDCLPDGASLYFINVNDNTCEGLRYHNFPGFSVQFHPEACAGPHDTNYLFESFMKLMEGDTSICH